MTVTPLVVQGETPLSNTVGNTIYNNWRVRAPKNLTETVSDMRYANSHGYNIMTASCTASAGSGVNLFSIPPTPFPYETRIGVSYDGINVINPAGSGAITGVGINFPPNPLAGQFFLLSFDVAVTTLTLVPSNGTTILSPITSATAGQTLAWMLVGSVWKPTT
jgi:hypothetical protein